MLGAGIHSLQRMLTLQYQIHSQVGEEPSEISLQSQVHDAITFVQRDGGPSERETLLLPLKFTDSASPNLTSLAQEKKMTC